MPSNAGLCIDCQRDTHKIGEYYMVQNRVWKKANPEEKGMLCIGCLERRLGHKLHFLDFLWCPLNVQNVFDPTASKRLRDRLGCNYLVEKIA